MAVLGEVKSDEARKGMAWRYSASVGVVKQGPTWLGAAVRGKVGYGVKRSDMAWRYGVRHSSTVQGSERRGGTRSGGA